MSKYVAVGSKSDFQDGAGKVFRVSGRTIAMFKVGEEFFAMDNFCLHRGGPLGEGEVDGYSVICPWHGWTYDLRTGSFEIIAALKVRTYPTKVEGDSVLIDVEAISSPGIGARGRS